MNDHCYDDEILAYNSEEDGENEKLHRLRINVTFCIRI